MSLVDRTNEEIVLLHYGDKYTFGTLQVDVDQDSSFDPANWVYFQLTDAEHDADLVTLTYAETELLYQRLGLILGKLPLENPTHEYWDTASRDELQQALSWQGAATKVLMAKQENHWRGIDPDADI